MWNKTKSLQLSILLVRVLFVFIPILMLCVPVITEWYDAVYGEGIGLLGGRVALPLSICLYLAALCGLVCLWALHKLLMNLKKEEVSLVYGGPPCQAFSVFRYSYCLLTVLTPQPESRWSAPAPSARSTSSAPSRAAASPVRPALSVMAFPAHCSSLTRATAQL